MSRPVRKMNRAVRTFRERLQRVGDQAIDQLWGARDLTLDQIKAVTRPGWVVRLWRWVFAR